MKTKRIIQHALIVSSLLWLSACSLGPVDTPEVAHYFLQVPPMKPISHQVHQNSIMVAPIQSAPGYSTDAMRYVITPYQLQSFATHSWISPPAQLWQPLLESALSQAGAGIIVHSPSPIQAKYHLGIVLNRFEQNFQKPQSVFDMTATAVLQNVATGKVLGQKTFAVTVPAQKNTPYAGVLAANQAVAKIDQQIASFLLRHEA